MIKGPIILDACCGGKSFWFDKNDDRVVYADNRCGAYPIDVGTPGTCGRRPIVVKPDILSDFQNLPFNSCTFDLVVFDPPHIKRMTTTGAIVKRFGRLFGDWETTLMCGFEECFRVLKDNGILIFKWCEVEIKLSKVLSLTSHKPLFGHLSGRKANTHWIAFIKPGKQPEDTIPDDWMSEEVGMARKCAHILGYDIGGVRICVKCRLPQNRWDETQTPTDSSEEVGQPTSFSEEMAADNLRANIFDRVIQKAEKSPTDSSEDAAPDEPGKDSK